MKKATNPKNMGKVNKLLPILQKAFGKNDKSSHVS